MRIRTRGVDQRSPGATPATPSTDLTRRRLLFTLGASGAGAVAVSAAPASAALAAPVDNDSEDAAYRETRHVRDYYRTTKV